MANGKVLLKDIARETGFTVGTVSSVLRGRFLERRIPEATVRRIRSAARQLGYVPDIGARRLRSGAGTGPEWILAVGAPADRPSPEAAFLADLLRTFAAESGAAVSVTLETFSINALAEMPGLHDGERFNGMILTGIGPRDAVALETLRPSVELVLLDVRLAPYSAVLESPRSADLAVGHLLERGCRRMAGLLPRSAEVRTFLRWQGFREACRRAGVEDPEVVDCPDASEDSACQAVLQCFARPSSTPPDGLYCPAERQGVGALRACHEAGRAVPGELAVLGTGMEPLGNCLVPSLSTVGAPRENLCREAARLLIDHLTGRRQGPWHVEISPILHQRESTAADKREL